MPETSEEWKPHPVFTEYECHASGQVRVSPERRGRGLRAATAGQILTPLERGGLLYVRLRRNAERFDYSLAQMVCEAFGKMRPSPAAQIRHSDGDPCNCRLDNLDWSEEPAPFPIHLLEPGEEAAPLRETPGYWVTSHGRFYSLPGRRWLRFHIAHGRPAVLLVADGKEIRRAAALLVALHFPKICGEPLDGPNPRVLQKDNDPLNCRADNLLWGSHRELLEHKAKDRQARTEKIVPKIRTRRPPTAPPESEIADGADALSYAMDWLLKQGRTALPAGDPTTGHVFYYIDGVFNPLCANCASSRVRQCLASGKCDETMPVEQIILWPAKPHLGWQAHTIDCADCKRLLEPGEARMDLA